MTDGHPGICGLILPGPDPSQVRVVWELVSVPSLLSFPSQASYGLLGTAGDLAFGLFGLSRNKIKEGTADFLEVSSPLFTYERAPTSSRDGGCLEERHRGSFDPRNPLRGP